MTSKHGRKASSASPSTAAKKAAKAEAHQKAAAARRAGKAEAHLKKARDSVIALLDDKRLPEEAKARLGEDYRQLHSNKATFTSPPMAASASANRHC